MQFNMVRGRCNSINPLQSPMKKRLLLFSWKRLLFASEKAEAQREVKQAAQGFQAGRLTRDLNLRSPAPESRL